MSEPSKVVGSSVILGEFREFIARGNVIDLAVGVIIGAAFSNIVKSLVDQVVMPPIGLLPRRRRLRPAEDRAEAGRPGAPRRPRWRSSYGAFINTMIKFLIIAWVVFLMVKGGERHPPQATPRPTPRRRRADAAAKPLLTEIRDLLKARPSARTALRRARRTP